MSAISSTTRSSLKAYIEVFIENIVNEYKERRIPTSKAPREYLNQKSSSGQLKPFHAAIIPQELMRINEFERGFSTRVGTTFEECARLIALEHHALAQRAYTLSGQVSRKAINETERQVRRFEHAASGSTDKPTLEEMVEEVLQIGEDEPLISVSSTADLYIKAKNGNQYFFEMKSPKPNKGQCLEVTQRLLRFHLLTKKRRPEVNTYFAMAYNPYGPNRSDYRWSYALNYMPFDQGVLIGHEFWEIVGGVKAYEELLGIYQEVGREKSKYMIDALAFGF
ncbi:MAG: TdeIII family type II restriction endonuclease [Candidatus Hodarchaeota archaeon]